MTAQTPAVALKTVEIPIQALPRIYWAVIATSKAPEQEWQQLCGERLSAECIECGIKVSGEELRQLATMDLDQPMEDPKLDRLRLKYCARNTCQSRFYRVSFLPESELHWSGIMEQLRLATPDVREKKPRIQFRVPSISLTRHRALILGVTLCAMLVLFFGIRHWVYGYRIPVLQKKHEYRVIQTPE